ncbi:M48 family metalloprotease [Melittangium boletus]|uniref:Peptidase M48 domain-containing protein n=1 Tax=Melittangium boletus DSM 14713 TaxID=1294270 RepID=A0A250IT65_9BACT|nr:M48 family metalloprotease [Melittangium boletus]ATB34341.1 hypothetical protein MEBOL_007842 [Melittangium boletus DSM 14713]
MNRRLILPVACLLLCGFGTCSQYIEAKQESLARKEEMVKECAVLESRVISFDEERAFGGAVGVRWVSEGGGLTKHADHHALHVQLNKIGKNLAAQSSRPSLPWTFGVLQSEGINAVSGPGGYVFVSEGLLARLDNEAELAGVLAHEIAHITRKHALIEYQKFLVDECRSAAAAEGRRPEKEALKGLVSEVGQAAQNSVAELVGALSWGQWGEVLAQVTRSVNGFNIDEASESIVRAIMDSFLQNLMKKGLGKDDEYAADLDAVELMAAAGYAPEAYVSFLGKLPTKGLSTPHPSNKDRQKRLATHLDELRERGAARDFTTPVDLTRTAVIPLRDELLARRAGSAER